MGQAQSIVDLLKSWGPRAGLIILTFGAVVYLVLELMKILAKWLDKNQDREAQLTTLITNHLAHVQESNERSIEIQTKQLEEMRSHSKQLDTGFALLNRRLDKQDDEKKQFERDLFGKLGG